MGKLLVPTLLVTINGIFYLRDIKDSMKIQSKISISQNIVLLGAGYINLEIISST